MFFCADGMHDVFATGSEFLGAEHTLKVLANEGYFDRDEEETASGGPIKVLVLYMCVLWWEWPCHMQVTLMSHVGHMA